ncbi:MAG: rhodanese-like domain-containing protein [Mariprofundus sp.]|nr:rhodanese-like domain-containing protein [Mariprofundus sp.]
MAKGLKDFVAAAKATVEEISTADVESKLDSAMLLLDVREPGELQAGLLPGALNVPRGVLELKADLEFPMREARLADRDQEIVIYCASGGRSLLAAATLLDMGFTNVKSMACGFGGWQQEGRKIASSVHQ